MLLIFFSVMLLILYKNIVPSLSSHNLNMFTSETIHSVNTSLMTSQLHTNSNHDDYGSQEEDDDLSNRIR